MTSAPKKIADWNILNKLTQGGASEIFLVVHSKSGQEAVLKLYASDNPLLLEGFTREFAFLLTHHKPFLPVCYDSGYYKDRPYYTMERLRPLDPPYGYGEAFRIACALAKAFIWLHEECRVYHADIKPDNIMLRGDEVVVTDFGLMRYPNETLKGITVGTKHYWADEVVNHGYVTAAADVFSLSRTLQTISDDAARSRLAHAIANGLQGDPMLRTQTMRLFLKDLHKANHTVLRILLSIACVGAILTVVALAVTSGMRNKSAREEKFLRRPIDVRACDGLRLAVASSELPTNDVHAVQEWVHEKSKSEEIAKALVSEGRAHFEAHRYKEAFAIFHKVINVYHHSDGYVHWALAVMYRDGLGCVARDAAKSKRHAKFSAELKYLPGVKLMRIYESGDTIQTATW